MMNKGNFMILERLRSGKFNQYDDLFIGLAATYVWGALGWHDIRQRYRRSVLGPFWITLSTAILIVVLGFLYSTLLKQDIRQYLPYLAIGLIVWQYMASVMNEACDAFISSAYLIKQIRMPLTIHVCRVVWRNFIVLLHSLPIAILVLLAFGKWPNMKFLLLPLGLLILLMHGVWVVIAIGILCTRFRDFQPIINNFVSIAFFFTPIMWSPDILKKRAWIADFNPIYHILEIVRAPILGRELKLESWIWSIISLLLGFFLAYRLLIRYRDRVIYWL